MLVKSALLIVYNVNALLFIKLMKYFVYTFLSLRSVISVQPLGIRDADNVAVKLKTK